MKAERTFKYICFALCLFACLPSVARKTTILISCDGFRWDYPQYYDTPFLDAMAEKGVSGELVPSFPSKTFPNHYTLATGLRPEHHGIIANRFLNRKTGDVFSLGNPKTKMDGQYYKGEPLWITAQRQGLKTAVFYWPGSDVVIDGKRPDVWHLYDEKPHMTFEQRIDSIVAYATKPDAPDLIMAYFEEPDAHGHSDGPQSKKTQYQVERMDSLLALLSEELKVKSEESNRNGNHKAQSSKFKAQSTINLVVVSDHGMTWFTPSRNIRPSKYLRREWYDDLEGELPCNIYASESWQQDSIMAALKDVPHLRVWRKADIPTYLHYQADDNIGDILVLPDEGWLFYEGDTYDGGVHGYDPAYSDMHAIFRAIGPDINSGVNLGKFSNTAVYPFICHLLGIKPAKNDGEDTFSKIKDKALKNLKASKRK